MPDWPVELSKNLKSNGSLKIYVNCFGPEEGVCALEPWNDSEKERRKMPRMAKLSSVQYKEHIALRNFQNVHHGSASVCSSYIIMQTSR